ncbi:hypothetical protein [Phenylobacterium sp.]|uniref:hypothetical protein n=1 Tax=Phenylobacterium sp. TaxID=1871053 RepID=UPI00301C65A8
MAESGSYARGDRARSVLDPLAEPYARSVAWQAAYNARQEAELERRRREAARAASASTQPASVQPLAERMYRPDADDIAELRRQQAAFKGVTRDISRENAWMAVPALAPAAAVLGVEAGAMLAARLAPAVARAPPLRFVQREPYLRVGDNWATRTGRKAHAALRERVAQKPGWDPNPHVTLPDGRVLKPDVRTPARVRASGQEPKPFQMELKPDTVSGRRAAARAVKKYKDTEVKTRPIYYDPKSIK